MERINLLKDFLLAAATFEECHRNTLFVIDLLESLGFRIKREKSELIPSHSIALGFVVDSVQMSISLPVEKDSFNPVHGNASERQSSNCFPPNFNQILRMCTTRPAVFQAPAHYRHLQFVKNLVLRNSVNPIGSYSKQVHLNKKAREDLA